MKLNLLPTHVSKASSARTSMIISILIIVVCALGAVFLYSKANNDLRASIEEPEPLSDLKGKAEKAKATADVADEVIAKAQPILRNINLAEAMLKHNSVYPDTYDEIKRYIPSFYRVTSMQAAPTGPDAAQITLVGVLDTYQQYADLMLALLRIPGVQSVARQGFNNNLPIVPGLTPNDQYGRPHKPGEEPIPDNPLDRLQYFQSRGSVTGFQGVGGYGSGAPGLRGPMPNASQVTVNIVIARNLQTPDPRATLTSGRSTTGAGGGPAAGGGGAPTTGPTSLGAGKRSTARNPGDQ